METIEYNKLVRDRIPEIIASSGKICETEILSDEEYLRMIDAKLDEELAEYHQDQSLEELADLLEVIRAAAVARGYTLEELDRIRAEKAVKRGAFEKKILLKSVSEKPYCANGFKQPHWDQEEAVALIALYLHQSGNVSNEQVEDFSRKCRKKAEIFEISVDEKYRNSAGIKMQLHCIDYIFTHGEHGLSNVSKLFYRTVEMYREDQEGFMRIAEDFEQKYGM